MAALTATALLCCAGPSFSQDFPTKIIRIVTSPPGGSNDFVSRLIVKGFADRPGWQFVVDNRPTIIVPEVVMRAPPDGYTLAVTGGTFITGFLIDKLAYDPLRDFATVTLTHRQPNLLVVHPSLPVKSV
jgi:tripartite-type tricarboxylate transporter receptor subunit TctC